MKAVSASANHVCAVASDGRGQCWGANFAGQLGDGSTQNAATPVVVSSLNDAVAVSAGEGHSCAVINDGRVQCWGANFAGQLGDGSRIDALTPVTVSGVSNAVAVSAGGSHSCAVKSTGLVQCWGANLVGQLGDGNTVGEVAATPVTVSGLSDAVAVSAGRAHTCAVTNDGRVQCWGENFDGKLGDGNTVGEVAATPVTVSGLSDVVAVSAGRAHTCAVTNDGRVQCWGSNVDGQLGDGGVTNALTPVTVSGLSNAVAVSAGGSHSCALYQDGAISCWGSNVDGQAGGPVWRYSLGGFVLEA
jgi:alpha-tubulin suppressor-like RCC1 family protein